MRGLFIVLARALEAFVVLLILSTLVFFALRILPGDPASLLLGDLATPAELDALRARLHLDESLVLQYTRFLRGLVTLDLGESLRHPGTPAMAHVVRALGPTSALSGLAVGMGAVTGVGVGILSEGPWLGQRRVWIERALVAIASIPLLAFAPVVTYVLAAKLRVVPLPGDPENAFAGLLFASSLLALPLAAHVGRVSRAALEQNARLPFLSVARSKGASAFRVWVFHALPASLGPIVTIIAAQLGALLGGAVVLERLFERKGLGTLILEAYASRDLPVLEGAIVAAGGLFVMTQALATAAQVFWDPRVRR